MNLEEFAALKVGDRITNPMGGARGEVVDTDNNGVRVRWLAPGRQGEPGPPFVTRHYSVASTIWMHWMLEVRSEEAEKGT